MPKPQFKMKVENNENGVVLVWYYMSLIFQGFFFGVVAYMVN